MDKKPTILGFKPTNEDWAMFNDLLEFFNKQQVIGSVNNADVLKLAISELHEKYCVDQKKVN